MKRIINKLRRILWRAERFEQDLLAFKTYVTKESRRLAKEAERLEEAVQIAEEELNYELPPDEDVYSLDSIDQLEVGDLEDLPELVGDMPRSAKRLVAMLTKDIVDLEKDF